jgi:hypothetical protein
MIRILIFIGIAAASAWTGDDHPTGQNNTAAVVPVEDHVSTPER